MTMQIFHGTCPIAADPLSTPNREKSEAFYERVVFDTWLDLFKLCDIPREARLVFTIYGREFSDDGGERRTELIPRELGWASLQLFNFERYFDFIIIKSTL